MKLVATEKSEQNIAVVDPWTVVHFSTGLAVGLMDIAEETALGGAVAYELVEQYVERQSWGQEFFETKEPEIPLNAIVDVLVFAVGYRIGRWWNRT